MNYAAAHAEASAKHDPTVAGNMDDYWTELKRLESMPEPPADGDDCAPEVQWARWFSENNYGRNVYSHLHAFIGGSDEAACRVSIPHEDTIEWDADPYADKCKRCCRVTA